MNSSPGQVFTSRVCRVTCAILHATGFVSVRPDGQRRLYSLKPEPFRELDRWLGQYRDLWEARLDRLEEALEKKRKKSKTSHQEQDT